MYVGCLRTGAICKAKNQIIQILQTTNGNLSNRLLTTPEFKTSNNQWLLKLQPFYGWDYQGKCEKVTALTYNYWRRQQPLTRLHLQFQKTQHQLTDDNQKAKTLLLLVCGSKLRSYSLLPSSLWNNPYSYLSWLGILLSLCNSLHPILLLHFQCFGGAGRAAEGRGNGCYSQATQGTATLDLQWQRNTFSEELLLTAGVLNLCYVSSINHVSYY